MRLKNTSECRAHLYFTLILFDCVPSEECVQIRTIREPGIIEFQSTLRCGRLCATNPGDIEDFRITIDVSDLVLFGQLQYRLNPSAYPIQSE